MKRILTIGFCLGLFLFSGAIKAGKVEADDVRGLWWNEEKTAKIKIYRAVNGSYYGKIMWLKEPNDEKGNPKTDPENPNPKLRSRARLGMLIMNSFEWDEDDEEWNSGTIYDPNNGKTYSGYMWLDEDTDDVLHLRGYVMGMTWLGRTSDWERIE